MKKILVLGLAALAAACGGGKKEKPIVYGVSQAPTATELAAVADAEATLEGSLTFVAPTDPGTGGPGLPDQLVSSLGGYTVASTMPDAATAKLVGTATRQTLDTGGMDPACLTTEVAAPVTTVRWGQLVPCTMADPVMGMTVGVKGWLSRNEATGVTTWDIDETFALTMTSTDGQVISMNGTGGLSGTLAVSADQIAIHAESDVDVTTSMGLTIREVGTTKLDGTVGYQPAPSFCIASGSLQLEQRTSSMGVDQNQGWRFDWSGCGAYTVAHGS